MPSTDLRPERLRCEYLTDPLGIDVLHPRLSWTLTAHQRGQRQTAYQILVASTAPRLLARQADVWESGRVPTSQSAHVVYGGPPLRSAHRYWWALRVWDRDDRATPFTSPAWWEMGLLRADDWQATWIGLGAHPSAPLSDSSSDLYHSSHLEPDPDTTTLDLPPSPYLCSLFTLPRPIRRARLYVTARGLYELHLNGQKVGDAALSPGWTDYTKRVPYQTYDVTPLLHVGENAVVAILGAGWFSGYLGFGGQNKHYGPAPELLIQLRVEHDTGPDTLIVSDRSWRGTTGPIVTADLLMGETYDARYELPGWDSPGFDDSRWAPVRVSPRDDTLLVADRAEPVRVTEHLPPSTITPRDDATTIVDMGQNMVGWVKLRVSGDRGTRVRLRFAEVLNPDGTLYTDNLRAARQTDSFVLLGQGVETFEPRFTFHGFRYVEVTGYPGSLSPDAITGCVVESAAPPAGNFVCSHPLVNRLQHAIVWGQRGNFLSVLTDCPQRDERLGWLADAHVFAPTACFNRDVAAFFTKWLIDVADAQAPDGAYPDVAPLSPRFDTLRHGAPVWGDAGVILPWTLYLHYADTRLLVEHFDGMVRWLDYVLSANPDLLWRHRRGNDYGDWLAVDADPPKELLSTAYFASSAHLLSRIAGVLGRPQPAAHYASLFERIKIAFQTAYLSPDGRHSGDTQTGYLLALDVDLLPDHLRPVAAQHLVENIVQHDWHLTTGFAGVGLLLPVLTDAGYLDVAYRLLLNDTFPSWGYPLQHGATTIWERWDGWTEQHGFQDPGMNSFNHYALGAVGDWLYRYVAGIDVDPQRPGFDHVVIHPWPGGGLTTATADYHSLRGAIASAWRIDGGAFTLNVTIPPGTTATVHVPAVEPAMPTEGGQPADTSVGVTFARW